MSRAVWKYDVPVDDQVVRLRMPANARIVHVGATHPDNAGVLQFWAEVDTSQPVVYREFFIVGTGHSIPFEQSEYRGTVIVLDGALVWHLYEAV